MKQWFLEKMWIVVLSLSMSTSVGLCSFNSSDDDDGSRVSISMNNLASSSDQSPLIQQNDEREPISNRENQLCLIGIHEGLLEILNVDNPFQRPNLDDDNDFTVYINQLVTLSAHNGFRKDGRATYQAKDLPGMTDNANRCGAFFYQVSRNILYTVSGLSETTGLGLLSIAQMYDFDQDVKDILIMSGTITAAAAPVIAGISYVFLNQKNDRVKQLKRAADAYNVGTLGLPPLYPEVSLKAPSV